MPRRWTTREVAYLERHANEGAAEVSRALDRTVASVRKQASRYGVSLRRWWLCPKCGMRTFRPLSDRTGWCVNCSKQRGRDELRRAVRELEDEVEREEAIERERQALYAKRHRLRLREKETRK